MDVMYTDKNRIPLGTLKHYSIDLENSDSRKDFEIEMNLPDGEMEKGSIWYVEGEEYGGIVDKRTVNTETNIVTYYGRSWRGILQKKIIRPDKGQDYLTLSGDANAVIRTLLQRAGISRLMSVPDEVSGFEIKQNRFDRYTTMYAGITKMLTAVGARLHFEYSYDRVIVSAVAVEDLSDRYEYSDDYGMSIIMSEDMSGINHLICLGSGELSERQVIDLYVDKDGKISTTQYYYGLNEIEEIYDYSSVESMDALRIGGIEKLGELKSSDSISAKFKKLDVEIGDIVGGKNRLTGITVKETITKEIVNIDNDILTVNYGIGEE